VKVRVASAWTLVCASAVLAGGTTWAAPANAPATTPAAARAYVDGLAAAATSPNSHILVDQFGYLPADAKVAVIRNPRVGYDRTDNFTPGTAYEVRRRADDSVVLSGTPAPWRDGAMQPSSGDQGWWFDFSKVTEPGKYVIYDVQRNQRSATFAIGEDVYDKVLQAAMRMFFYQRSAFAKKAPYAAPCWTDPAAYLKPNQDSQAGDITDPTNKSKRRDLSGGWSDAGDTGKYTTFAVQPVHQLLTAYEQHPDAFGDDSNIPESGNGIPDVIDEVRWETRWLGKMQFPDGGVALKLGETTYGHASPPSADTNPRFYVPACTSATIAAAGMYAHASYVYGKFPSLARESAELKSRAAQAWQNYQQTPNKQLRCDTGVIKGGNADWNLDDQNAYSVEAAIYLSAISDDPAYPDYVAAHYKQMRPYHDPGWSRYAPDQGEALLFYTGQPGANAALKAQILQDKQADATAGNQIYGFNPDDDLYRAFLHDQQYHWGSNNPRAMYGNTNLDVVTYNLPANTPTATYRQRALEIVHYFHGVNPLGMVYLTNMYSLGAARSANEIFHTWFQPGTRWSDARTSECGPPPGYVPGGPNRNAMASGVPPSVSPPNGQPPQKSYKDWNGSDASWAVSEPGIYYQSAYVKLLSAFVHHSQPAR
jgi:endoglucanase